MPADVPASTGACAGIEPVVLVAGVGNVLMGDDGFGVEVANRLITQANVPKWAKVIETGIGGMSLVQELMYGYEALIIIDAYARGKEPGELCLLEPVLPDLSTLNSLELRDYFADTHYATPIRALSLLSYVATPPKTLRILGCEPAALDDMKIGLSPAVAAAADKAVNVVTDLLKNYRNQGLGRVEADNRVFEEAQWRPRNQ